MIAEDSCAALFTQDTGVKGSTLEDINRNGVIFMYQENRMSLSLKNRSNNIKKPESGKLTSLPSVCECVRVIVLTATEKFSMRTHFLGTFT